MKKYRITKYDPANRNNEGHYLFDHWTEISDVGKTLEGELVTQEEYFIIEKNYINAVLVILKESGQDYLRLVGYDHVMYKESIVENHKEWYHEKGFENLELFEDKKIHLNEISTIIKLNLRRYIYTTLEIKDNYYVHFGYDFYMYVGAPKLTQDTISKLNSTMIFVEEFRSPYYSSELEYVVQINKKDSMYVEEEQTLKFISIEKMKEIFEWSNEHPGNIETVINREIADKIGISVDLDKNEYYLTTELKEE